MAPYRKTLFVLFFISGICGLVYEVVWTRLLTLTFGNTVFASSTVLAVFMAGLALGSYAFGAAIDKRTNVLQIYGYLEMGIGLYALLLPLLLSGATPLYIWFYRTFGPGHSELGLLRFLVSFLLLLFPTVCMGATLPVLSRYFVVTRSHLGRDIGLLYGLNTCGAVLGCFAAGFILIQLLGIQQTASLAASMNIGIGIIALGLQRRSSLKVAKEVEGPGRARWAQVRLSGRGLVLILICFGLSGFAALAYEVLWMRSLVCGCEASSTSWPPTPSPSAPC